MSKKYQGLSGDMWNVYGILRGDTPAGQMESRFQVLARKKSKRRFSFISESPSVSFCAFRFG